LLEDRSTPATFTVTTATDAVSATDGVFSLPEAIHAANNAGSGIHQINFDLTAMGYTPPSIAIRLTAALPPIDCTVIIDGQGAVWVGRGPFNLPPPPPGGPPPQAPKFRIFEINSGAGAVFNGLGMFAGEVDGDGGGILNNGSLLLDGCNVDNNKAGGSGGGIMNNGTLVLQGVTKITRNTAGADGGGIKSPGILSMSSSRVENNTAGGDGGGLHYSKGADCTIDLTFVDNNTAAGDGGGMYLTGPGGFTINVTDTFLNTNKSTGVGKRGGGIFLNQAELFYSGGWIRDNEAKGNGGGIFGDTNARLRMANASISANKTGAHGGGIALEPSIHQRIELTTCTFAENRTTDLVNGQGGGLFIKGESGSLLLTDCTFNSNTAAKGGGVYTERHTDVHGGRFVFNTAAVAGGAFYGGKADLAFQSYTNEGGDTFKPELSDNEAPANMGIGIAWEQNGGGLLLLNDGLVGNNADDISYI
jgi:predicted outer membrane repeat protein